MKIPNPWPYYSGVTRTVCTTPEGDVVSILVTRGPEIEVTDGATKVLVEPIKLTGRGGVYKSLGPPKVWTEAWGLLDVEDHATKQEIEAERSAQEAKALVAREAQEEPVCVWQAREADEEVEVDEPLDFGDELEQD